MRLTERVDRKARPLHNESDLSVLYDRIGGAGVVMLGEASHGTHEYYLWRAQISKDLIGNYGFNFIAVEGDWPECYVVNRYVKGLDHLPPDSRKVLQAFNRWPTWMWANDDIRELIEWMREYNTNQPSEKKVGFYGLDVYSLWESMDAIIVYLKDKEPNWLEQAYEAYKCFEPYGRNPHAYAHATTFVSEICRDEVVQLLTSMRSRGRAYEDGDEGHFNAEQNALVAKNAENYYRTMIQGDNESWNVRDRHMMATLARLLGKHGPNARGIVWAHNTHIGDARYTDMHDDRMINIGQLAREAFDEEDVVLVGFGTHRGDVIAGDYWGAPMRRMQVPDAQHGSIEEVFHDSKHGDFIWVFDEDDKESDEFNQWRGHRAIGVVYNPRYEGGNYVPTILPRRYDAFIFIDQTRALNPMIITPEHRVKDTYPSGV